MKYNLSWYEVVARYVIGILVLIPAAMFLIKPLIVLGAAIMLSALLGMCPIKALIWPNKQEVKKDAKQNVNHMSSNKNVAA
ncbi:MAG: DUF2892 domain-containing protein [Chitinophagales bacterium]